MKGILVFFNSLFNHFQSESIQLYQELDQPIVSVGLVKPVHGVFVDQIQYLLVIATTSEVTVVGLASSSKTFSGDIQLFNTQLSASTDNVAINEIVGTDQGRIFMCTKNGQLFELFYDSGESSLFGQRKCRKKNHSQSIISDFIPSFLNWRTDGMELFKLF